MDHGERAPSPVVRIHYAFGLRDEIPVPAEGWTVFRHLPACQIDEHGDVGAYAEQVLRCAKDACLNADVCRIFTFEGTDESFALGTRDIAEIVSRLTNAKPPDEPLARETHIPRRRAVAVVGSAPINGEDTAQHYARCMGLLHDMVKALRQSTAAHTPNVTIERVWPLYMILREHEDSTFEVQNIVVVEHGFRGVPTPNSTQLETAQRALLAAWRNNPVEVYLDFELDAQRACETDGDYVECILKAAAAAEVLIKHTAWMLTWEAKEVLPSDPASLDYPASDAPPRALLGSVLATRLQGNWSSQAPSSPIGAWRHHIARQRNTIIHTGRRPTALEAQAAVNALAMLEQHILDRLSIKTATYPRVALLIAGEAALRTRGAFQPAQATYEGESLAERLAEYLTWLEAFLGSDLE